MIITKAAVNTVIDDRCGAFLVEARRMTGDATKPSINQCIGWAVRQLGFPTAALTDVSDSDLSAVPDGKADALLDLTELRTLQSIETNLTAVTSETGPVSDEWNDLSKRLAAIIPRKQATIMAQHGIALDKPLDTLKRKAHMRAV